MVLKYSPQESFVSAYFEANAYFSLEVLQGLFIPYCDGVYDIEGKDGIGLLLEKIGGTPLGKCLRDSHIGEDDVYRLFMNW